MGGRAESDPRLRPGPPGNAATRLDASKRRQAQHQGWRGSVSEARAQVGKRLPRDLDQKDALTTRDRLAVNKTDQMDVPTRQKSSANEIKVLKATTFTTRIRGRLGLKPHQRHSCEHTTKHLLPNVYLSGT